MILLLLLSCCSFLARAQDAEVGFKELALNFQQYPTGSIPGLTYTTSLKPHQSLQFRVGYNFVYHGDAGVQSEETGGGFGFSPAWMYAFQADHQGLYLGTRLDIWFNTIDWVQYLNAPGTDRGSTKLVVVQPTATIGYRLFLGDRFTLTPELALGVEINAISEGEPTGQGIILLGGLSLGRRF
jgi:hypothetical protein